MNKINEVQPYQMRVSKKTIEKWSGVVRVWSEPRSAVDGAEVIDEIRKPVEVTVLAEQKDMYGSLTQRAKIRYGDGREGWVLYDALTK